VRTKIAAAVALLLFAAPGTAAAGDVTPIQYAYGGGSNAAAVGATRPPAAPNGGSTAPGSASAGGGSATGGTGSGTSGPGSGGGGTGSGTGGSGSGGQRPTETTAGPLVGLAGVPSATSASSFDTFHRAVPTGALWAIALAVACALGAWLVRRRSA
jgi:hypothetical protein